MSFMFTLKKANEVAKAVVLQGFPERKQGVFILEEFPGLVVKKADLRLGEVNKDDPDVIGHFKDGDFIYLIMENKGVDLCNLISSLPVETKPVETEPVETKPVETNRQNIINKLTSFITRENGLVSQIIGQLKIRSHGDLKPDQMLIDLSGDVSLVDWTPEGDQVRGTGPTAGGGENDYRPPEVRGEAFDPSEKRDVFSLATSIKAILLALGSSEEDISNLINPLCFHENPEERCILNELLIPQHLCETEEVGGPVPLDTVLAKFLGSALELENIKRLPGVEYDPELTLPKGLLDLVEIKAKAAKEAPAVHTFIPLFHCVSEVPSSPSTGGGRSSTESSGTLSGGDSTPS